MADVFTKARRSAVMSRIRGTGNKDTELRLIALMRAAGIVGWRRGGRLQFAARSQRSEVRRQNATNAKSSVLSARRVEAQGRRRVVKIRPIRIRPDFVFPKQRLAVFVDGCFWHGCPRHATWPKNRAAFWLAKLSGNKARDRLHNRLLRKNQWRVLRIWEHSLSAKCAGRTIARIQHALHATRSRVLPGKTLARAHRGQ